jgi:hypothetical protein
MDADRDRNPGKISRDKEDRKLIVILVGDLVI